MEAHIAGEFVYFIESSVHPQKGYHPFLGVCVFILLSRMFREVALYAPVKSWVIQTLSSYLSLFLLLPSVHTEQASELDSVGA